MTGSAGFRTPRRLLTRSLSLCALAGIGVLPACQHSAEPVISTTPGVSYTVLVTGLAGPRGLLFSPGGDLYVVEQASGDIARVTRDGQVSRIAKGLSDPHDLAMDSRGNLYVAETGQNRVVRISPAGAVTTYIAGLSTPVDLDFNPQGELLVCELWRGRVLAYTSPGMRDVASGNS